MEALKRKPDLSVRKSMEFPDGTKIEVIGLTARANMEIANNKKLSDFDRGIQLTAAKILVDGKPVVYDDLLDSFTDKELEQIIAFANDIKIDKDGNENSPNE